MWYNVPTHDISPGDPLMPEAQQLEKCANCDRPIGRLETPYLYQSQVVCKSCYDRLVPVATYATPAAAPKPPMAAQAYGDYIICPNPNCGYTGPGQKKSKGSAVVMILLLLLWVVPGILYAIIYNGHVIVCPKCGMKVRDA
jgi:hypothetical protein